MSETTVDPEATANQGRFSGASGLGIPSRRGAAFNPPLQAAKTPPPNPYLAAERRLQDSHRSTHAAKTGTDRICPRCATVMLPDATVCSTCCAPAQGTAPQSQPAQTAAPVQPQIAKQEMQPQIAKQEMQPQIAKQEVQPQIAKQEMQPQIAKQEMHPPAGEAKGSILAMWPFGPAEPEGSAAENARTRHHLSVVPTQRTDEEPVRAVGPNPFRAAASGR